MNFFKSVFADEPDPPPHGSDHPDPPQSATATATATATAAWSFEGLIQTIASKSESVLENYRRDLEEFGSGLRKETAVIREAASRAVKDLPASLDAGASVAQVSLESVGQAIDDIGSTVWKSTAEIISHGRESLLASDSDYDSFDSSNYDNNNAGKKLLNSSSGSGQGLDVKRYSRFDALVRALQCDVNTYLEEPEDLEKFNEWKLGFELDKKGEEIRNLIEENGVIEKIYEKAVPSRTDHESFWSKYFYKLHKLKQAEDARAKLVKRAISGDEEEDLSWDFDDEDDDNGGYEPLVSTSGVSELKNGNSAEVAADVGGVECVQVGKKDLEIENDGKGVDLESKTVGDDESGEVNCIENVASNVPANVTGSGDKLDVKYEEKEASEVKTDNDNGGSCKDSDISVVSSQPSMPGEEEIGWDEIEDIESNDENKGGDAVESASRIDLRKRLSVADQEEDLSWDIEDDDETVKS
ncbi:BSD domain-containing protein 1-like [Abrus precatorius]|uniref:BSD domain-containing protein 1-like n=1 Tax=Abrus precatorius TaxID=3816 RepID=A0A8B8JTT2_ABRPR|nr:BSD domain-containing protein 1-like [Abrus precatorius]